MKSPACRLYLITPPVFETAVFAEQLKLALSGGDVACVQLRMKDADDAAVLEAGRALMPLVQTAGAAFIINDRPDLTAALGADGVHVGQQDAPYAEARRLLGKDRIVGVTCHASRHLAMSAADAGADYVAFGAIYETGTKEAPARAGLDLITWWHELFETPCVAIGGITTGNAAPVIAAGADFLAVSAGVWRYPDGPKEAVRRFNELFASSV